MDATDEDPMATTSAAADNGADSAGEGALIIDESPMPATPPNKPPKPPKPSAQPSFDFDYDGPPVIVSNGMALELVNRFGLNNAWGAFLKLKGHRTPYDKSAPQPPEHVQALKRFRRKIRTVREMFNALRDKNEDTSPLMSREFVVLLKAGDEPEQLDGAAQQKKGGRIQKPSNGSSGATDSVDAAALGDEARSPNGTTEPKRSRKPKPKKDANRLGVEKTPSTPSPNPPGSAQRIDEIVANVIDRVMQTPASTSTALPLSSAHQAGREAAEMVAATIEAPVASTNAVSGLEPLHELYRHNPALLSSLGAGTLNPLSLHNVQTLLNSVRQSNVPLANLPTASVVPSTATARLLLQHQHSGGSLDAATAAQLLLPATPQPAPAVNGFGAAPSAAPFSFLNAPAVIRALATQPSTSAFAPISSAQWATTTAAAMDVAQLPGPLSVQVGGAVSAARVDANETDEEDRLLKVDVSSRATTSSAATSGHHTAKSTITPPTKPKPKPTPKDKKRTASVGEEKPPTSRKSSKSSAAARAPSPQSSAASTTKKKPPAKKPAEKKENQPTEPAAAEPTAQLSATIAELREQVEELDNQLNAERTKFAVQKRRMDMMKDKLKKKDDELQTARIDYACQKTDNALVKDLNEQLRQENEELKKRVAELEDNHTEDGNSSAKPSLSALSSPFAAISPIVPSTSAATPSAVVETPPAAAALEVPSTRRRPPRRPPAATVKTELADAETDPTLQPATSSAKRKPSQQPAAPKTSPPTPPPPPPTTSRPSRKRPRTEEKKEEPKKEEEAERRQSKRLSAARNKHLYANF